MKTPKIDMYKSFLRRIIDQKATHENAKAYAATDDKFVFCIDLLGLTAAEVDESETFTHLVGSLEDRFDDLNAT